MDRRRPPARLVIAYWPVLAYIALVALTTSTALTPPDRSRLTGRPNAMSTRTHTRTHVTISFANPYLRCDQCHQPVPRWHDSTKCGCDGGFWNEPCEHRAGVTSACPSWSPVDGCTCAAVLGAVGHN